MSSKPTRVRKVANRNPTSLALPVPIPLPDPILDQIDPQLTNIDADVNVAVNVVYSPFSDACLTPPIPGSSIPGPIRSLTQSPSPTPANTPFESFEAVIEDDSQPLNTTQVPQSTKKGFTWSFIIEQTLFNELLNQANNGKRADNGFKKEAWAAACVAVETVTTQLAIVERCKGKAEVIKALWKGFIWLKDQSGSRYNKENGLITTSEQAWQDIIKV